MDFSAKYLYECDNRDRAWRQLKHLQVFCSFGVCVAVPCRYQHRAWDGVLPAPKGCRKIQFLTGMSFRGGGEGGDEVSNTHSWPPPRRNRRAVTTSGFSVPACANDMLDAGLAPSLSPGHVLCSPRSFQHRYWAARGQGTLDLGQCCSGLTTLTTLILCVCCH